MSCLLRISFSFFFFQAEDGIRDYKVTGVQTCALPISWRPLTEIYPPLRQVLQAVRPPPRVLKQNGDRRGQWLFDLAREPLPKNLRFRDVLMVDFPAFEVFVRRSEAQLLRPLDAILQAQHRRHQFNTGAPEYPERFGVSLRRIIDAIQTVRNLDEDVRHGAQGAGGVSRDDPQIAESLARLSALRAVVVKPLR